MAKKKEALGDNIPGGKGVKAPERKGVRDDRIPTVKRPFSLPIDLFNKLDAISYWDRVTQRDIVIESLREHIARREKDRGKPYPAKPAGIRSGPGRPTKC